MEQQGEITRILLTLRGGDQASAEKLIPLIYDELHRLAASYMRRERPDHTLQATALVNEAYLKLIDQREQDWKNRAHFFGVAAHLMRLILIDYARRGSRVKRGGDQEKITLDKVRPFQEEHFDELIAIDEALHRLSALDPRIVKVVELRFFAGLTIQETAEVLNISPEIVKRDWKLARPWLARAVSAGAA